MSYKSHPIVDNAIALRLLAMLCTPFDQFPAYKTGVIDKKGKYIVPKYKRTYEQKQSLTYLDRLIINVKKLINKLPGGENKLKNIISAMVLIRESYQANIEPVLINESHLDKVVDQYSIKDPRYQRMISVWAQYLKQKQQNESMTSGAIGGDQNGMPANNTTGVAITTLPLSQNSIVKRRNNNHVELVSKS